VTHLRQQMLDELQRRNYSQSTARSYIHAVEDFAKYFHRSPERLGPEHIRQYQAYLFRERKLSPGTIEGRTAALRFLFVKTLRRPYLPDHIPFPKRQRRLPTILDQQEVARLIDSAGNHRLVAFENDRVSFRWRDYAHGGKKKVMTVSAHEFLLRFLLHVLPSGLVRIRHFGLFANRRRSTALERCRVLLGSTACADPPEPPSLRCPACSGIMLVVERLTRGQLYFHPSLIPAQSICIKRGETLFSLPSTRAYVTPSVT